jgi:hypothetical protein
MIQQINSQRIDEAYIDFDTATRRTPVPTSKCSRMANMRSEWHAVTHPDLVVVHIYFQV